MEGWGGTLKEIVLIPGTGGVFDVDVDGERIYSKRDEGHSVYPAPDDILRRLRDRIGPEPI